ncbi:MAG: glycosyltransferase family 1 protein, partial [Candidatus Omnitrophica bacterium]|nr:glycosyltransferase family 1 protein [Candidatus Omnitrophota bacterium]
LVTNRIKKNGFEELFTDRENLVVYRSPRELFKLIDFYLTHPEQREQIADAGYKLVTSRHRYLDRLKTMFELIRASDQNRYRDLKV